MNTQEEIFANFFRRHSQGNRNIMAAMLEALLQGCPNLKYRQVVQAGYIVATK